MWCLVHNSVCTRAVLDDLDPGAIAIFRDHWAARSRRSDLGGLDTQQLLIGADLLPGKSGTNAAMILLGKPEAELREAGRAHSRGMTRTARWHSGPEEAGQ